MANSDEKETLRQATESAEALIGQLEEKRQKFNQKIDAKLEPLRRIVEAWESFTGKKPKTPSSSHSTLITRKRVRRGQVEEHIFSVLCGNKTLSEPEIRETINQIFNMNYSRSTVYSALVRGEGKGKFEERDNKWTLKEAPGMEVWASQVPEDRTHLGEKKEGPSEQQLQEAL